jgi:hypothetical protein
MCLLVWRYRTRLIDRLETLSLLSSAYTIHTVIQIHLQCLALLNIIVSRLVYVLRDPSYLRYGKNNWMCKSCVYEPRCTEMRQKAGEFDEGIEH